MASSYNSDFRQISRIWYDARSDFSYIPLNGFKIVIIALDTCCLVLCWVKHKWSLIVQKKNCRKRKEKQQLIKEAQRHLLKKTLEGEN